MTTDTSDTSVDVKELSALHRKVMRLIVAGMRNGEIASLTGLTSVRVSQLRNSPLIKSRVLELQREIDSHIISATSASHADIAKRIAKEQLTSVDTVTEIRDNGESEHARLKAAFGILDRGGHSTIQKSLVVSATVRADGTLANLLRVMSEDRAIAPPPHEGEIQA